MASTYGEEGGAAVGAWHGMQKAWNKINSNSGAAAGTEGGVWSGGGSSVVWPTGATLQKLMKPQAVPAIDLSPTDQDALNKMNASMGIPTAPTATPSSAKATVQMANTGSIYKVPGSATKSGKPYIGRHNKPDPAKTRKSSDGRDRKKANVIDTYDPNNVAEDRKKEQQAIDNHGGVDNLDNKRNEIKKDPN